MPARLAKCLVKLREQVNAAAPHRSKSSDGWIGDAAHSARKSDHNPNAKGVVQAFDITHDPKNSMDAHALAEVLRQNRDPRIKYVISNGRIFSQATKPWQWRKYTGSNPHTKHVHVSVEDVASAYDDASPWQIGAAKPAPAPAVVDEPPPKKTKITEGAAVGGGLSIAGIGATVWENVQTAPESLLQAIIGAASRPTFWIIVGTLIVCGYIIYRRRKMKKA